MTLESAIKHCMEVAEEKEQEAQRWIKDGWQSNFKALTPERESQYFAERKRLSNQCLECASEHRQLATWLRELKAYREAREEIQRKAKSNQWSEAVVYGLTKAVAIIDKCLFAHNVGEVKADEKEN